MLSNTIIESDKFLDLPYSTRFLYIYLNSQADGMGFITNKKAIIRTLGLDENGNDLQTLIDAGYIIEFKQSSVICIKHWHSHNTNLKKKTTDCCEEFEQLEVGKRTGEYFFKGDVPEIEQKPAYEPKTEMIDEEDLPEYQEQQEAEEEAAEAAKTISAADDLTPTFEEVEKYFDEQRFEHITAKAFYDEMEAQKWCDSKGEKIKNWQGFAAWNNKQKEKAFEESMKSYQQLKTGKKEPAPKIDDFKNSRQEQPAEKISGYDASEDVEEFMQSLMNADHNGFC